MKPGLFDSNKNIKNNAYCFVRTLQSKDVPYQFAEIQSRQANILQNEDRSYPASYDVNKLFYALSLFSFFDISSYGQFAHTRTHAHREGRGRGVRERETERKREREGGKE